MYLDDKKDFQKEITEENLNIFISFKRDRLERNGESSLKNWIYLSTSKGKKKEEIMIRDQQQKILKIKQLILIIN